VFVKTKFIFDVDGTLTPSRGIMDYNFKAFFNTFCLMNDVYLVTGSDKPKTVEQISEGTYNLCKRVYQCSGSDVWQGDENILKSEWILPIEARHWLEQVLDNSDFNIRTGNHIEHRTGMINFSIVGRNANAEQRAAYVKSDDDGERNYIARAFNNFFPNLQATVGGETGIDISPRGADKSQILRDFKKDDTIHFYGDAMFKSGNDYPLAEALKEYQLGFSHQVDGWQHTWEKLREHFTNRT
jgi:phosphomannomutase